MSFYTPFTPVEFNTFVNKKCKIHFLNKNAGLPLNHRALRSDNSGTFFFFKVNK